MASEITTTVGIDEIPRSFQTEIGIDARVPVPEDNPHLPYCDTISSPTEVALHAQTGEGGAFILFIGYSLGGDPLTDFWQNDVIAQLQPNLEYTSFNEACSCLNRSRELGVLARNNREFVVFPGYTVRPARQAGAYTLTESQGPFPISLWEITKRPEAVA
ncbi:hypothetical protein JW710_03925 [Candidatus Dojkabacteria bacterium]|nr:hypothetical protein [Candidatus Dojkabacteria bacterium]